MADIVLVNLPAGEVRIDLVGYDTNENFMGFTGISGGVHYVRVKLKDGFFTGFWCFLKDHKSILVKKYNETTNKFEDDTAAETRIYIQKVKNKELVDNMYDYDFNIHCRFTNFAYCIETYGRLPDFKMDNTLSSIPSDAVSPIVFTFNNLYQRDLDWFFGEFQYAFLSWVFSLETEETDMDAVKRWVDMIHILYTATQEDMDNEAELILTTISYFIDQIIYMHETVFNYVDNEPLYKQIFDNTILPFINNLITHEDKDFRIKGKKFAGILEELGLISRSVDEEDGNTEDE